MVIKAPKKLIEVALPLDDINEAAAREKSIRHGHPSTLHLWWARRPLAAARAVLFAQMVNDPGGERGYRAGMTKEQAQVEREKLFDIIRDLVKWENTNNPAVLERARAAIRKSWRETCELNKGKPGFDPDVLPAFHDPFAGGGAIPLEAQRLGLESYASDLNPVAVLINKAMIEIPPKFAGRAPVGPLPAGEKRQGSLAEDWSGAKGLAEDVRRYGAWMREEAFKRIGHLYPKVDLKTGLPVKHGEEQPGQETATVIAWIWARTVKSPNPAVSHVDVPLVSSFLLSTKPGQEVWVEPTVENEGYTFQVRKAPVHGKPPEHAKDGTKARGRGADFLCLMTKTPISGDYIKAEGQAGRMGTRLLAVVADGPRERVYVSPTREMETVSHVATPSWVPHGEVPARLTGGTCYAYGLTDWGDLFTNRQLTALTTYAELIQLVRGNIRDGALQKGWYDDSSSLDDGGTGATAYADAVALYLALGLSRLTDICNALCRWEMTRTQVRNLFGRQAIPMLWDFAENNVFGKAAGDYTVSLSNLIRALEAMPSTGTGVVCQTDAQTQGVSVGKVVSTDPPYYDNIAYADLSDFFYVWLRHSLRPTLPGLFLTRAVPKKDELVAIAHRHGGVDQAERYFMDGMGLAMNRLASQSHSAYPVTIYYAFKQSDTSETGTANTGWATFLEAVLRAGFSITGTWPLRTELANRMVGAGNNALASSIVLVCRKRDQDAPTISRRELIRELKEVLPVALSEMTAGGHGRSPVAAVDLAQAIIGPGMAVFSKYAAVLEADGSPMTVHTALTLINTYLPGDPDEFDADTRFCLTWFEENGWMAGQYGQADVLARAKGTSVEHVADAGVVESGQGKVRLLKSQEYPTTWTPEGDKNTPVWEATHQLIRGLKVGETAAGALLSRMPDQGEKMRQLAYRLYTLCERKGWAEEARSYNELINSWSEIEQAATTAGREGVQTKFDI